MIRRSPPPAPPAPPTRNHLILPGSLALLAVLGAAPACSDGGGQTPRPDAGDRPGRHLSIVTPGEEIGINYSSRVTLAVRYLSDLGAVIRGDEVRFALRATRPGETTAGATLSATSAITDASGEARVELVTGAQDARFRVSVDARDAATVSFFVSVSQGGFARLEVQPTHAGWRALEDLTRVEVRLYPSAFVSCPELDIDQPPASAFPPRGLDGFGEVVTFQNVDANKPHTVVAWALTGTSPTPVAAGCLALDGAQIPQTTVRTELVVRDRDLIAAGDIPARATFDMTPVAAALEQAGATRAWDLMRCPAGPGQLVLDCMLDAAAPDDALDCEVGGAGDLLDAVESRRGAPGADGCRPAALDGGEDSLDQRLLQAVAEGAAFPTGADLARLADVRAATVDTLALDSALRLLGPGTAQHALITARVPVDADEHVTDLGATSRPVLEAPALVTQDGDLLELAEHGFTLRYASLVEGAFRAAGLAPAGVDAAPRALGRALLSSLRDADTGDTGCAAASAIACAAIGDVPGCLAQACEDATPVLDVRLAAWLDSLDGAAAGLDFSIAGAAVLLDPDGDLVIDALDLGGDRAAWSARITLLGGVEIDLPGGP